MAAYYTDDPSPRRPGSTARQPADGPGIFQNPADPRTPQPGPAGTLGVGSPTEGSSPGIPAGGGSGFHLFGGSGGTTVATTTGTTAGTTAATAGSAVPWGELIGAGVSYFGAQDANSAAARAAAGQGYVDLTTSRAPAPGSQPYLDAARQAAYDALFGTGGAPGAVRGDPNAGAPSGGGAGGIRNTSAAGGHVAGQGGRFNAKGQWVPAPASGGGAGGAGAPSAPAPFNGQSAETAALIGRASNLPAANAGLDNAGERYVTDSLAGRTTNPLLDRASTAADAISEDPRLTQYQDFLMRELGIGGPSSGGSRGSGGGGGTSVRVNYDGSAIAPRASSSTGTPEALRKLIAGENPAGWDAAEAGISRTVNEGRADNIRQLKAAGVGSGFYGGDYYNELATGAVAQGDRELADSLAAARYASYQNALGLGTQYDLGMADVASRDRASASSSAAAGASTAAQERLAKYGLLSDALQQGEQGRFGRAGALGDLAGLVSGDQRTALGGVSDIGASRRGDLAAAGQLSLGSDEARNSFLAARGSESVGRAQVGLGRANLAFDREQFYDPFARISAYTGILGQTDAPYGSETTTGRDTRSSSPPAYASPYGAALTGAAIGGQVAGAYQRPRTG